MQPMLSLFSSPTLRVPSTGFQAFNVNPATRGYQQQQYVPATLFLAADHLQVRHTQLGS